MAQVAPLTAQTESGSAVTGRADQLVADVFIVRFAKYGRVEGGPGPGFDFLVTMAECDGLGGHMAVPVGTDGEPDYPGHLRLSGSMIITVQVDAIPTPVRLRSRSLSVLEGSVAGWPPYDAVLTLSNGPIDYFYEQEIGDPEAETVLRIYGNTVTIGSGQSVFQSGKPQIMNAGVRNAQGGPWMPGQAVGGAAITWNDSSADASECPIDSFHVYRNPTPNLLGGWALAGAVPGTQHAFFDPEYDGTRAVEYLVVHATQFPFGYEYEGSSFGPPARVDAVVQLPACGDERCQPFAGENAWTCPQDCSVDGDDDGDIDLDDLRRFIKSFSGPGSGP